MGYIIAGLAIAAVGAGTSAVGTSQNASAVRDAAKFNAYLENKFGKKWTATADNLIKEKEDKLYNIGDIFERFNGGGAFGDTNTLSNLRKYQEDFSDLAAGDFSSFEGQLRSAMLDNLSTSVGTGSPVGSYAELSANTLLNLRRTGAAEAASTTGLLSGLHNELLGMEFGVMDQGFNLKYKIDRDRLSAITGYQSQAASTAGVGTQAAGTALQQIGSSIASYGMYQGQQSGGAGAGGQSGFYTGGSQGNIMGSGGASQRPTPYAYSAPAAYASAPIGYNAPVIASSPSYAGLPASYPSSSGPAYGVLPALDPYQDIGGYSATNYDMYGRPQTTPGFGLMSSPFTSISGTGYDIIGSR